MGIEDRVEEEMVVDSESLLEDQFDRAKKIVKILDDGSINLHEDYRDLPPKPRILAYLVGKTYVAETDRADNAILSYEFFYPRFNLDESTVRHYANELEDEGLIESAEGQGEKLLVVENISRAIDVIEEANE